MEYTEDSLATLSCYDYSEGAVFVYSGPNFQAKEATLLGCQVNDLVISGKNAYFCGEKDGFGIIGYFDINDVFFGTGNIKVIFGFLLGTYSSIVKELTRMTVFSPDNDNEHIACIGTCENFGYNRPCLIDFDADASSPSYVGGEVDTRVEVFTDVKVVTSDEGKDYLVTVGFDTTFGHFLNIRVYDPNNVFQPSGIQDICHVYSMSVDDARTWQNHGALLTQLETDTFATVSYRNALEREDHYYEALLTPTNIHIGVFKLSDIVNNSVWGLKKHYEIPLHRVLARNIEQVIYSSVNKRMVFLHTYLWLGERDFYNCFVELTPSALTNSGILQAYKDPGVLREGLSLYNAETGYVFSGFINSNPSTLKFEMETFNATPYCVESLEYEYEQQREIGSMNFERKFTVISKDRAPAHYEIKIIDLPLFKDCEK